MIDDILKEDGREDWWQGRDKLLPSLMGRPSWLLYHRVPIYPMDLRFNLVPQPIAKERLPESSTKSTSDETDDVPNYLRTLLDESRKHRRNRTVFSRFQMQRMDEKFLHKKYLSTQDRNDFAKSLCLTSLQLKTWFQNRRMKWKKEMLKIDPTAVTTRSKGRPRKDEF
ncbi:hypothetical protein QZH41_007587 [Actinostola sp. cb2023]|nr:hypothetical protein QZH41_007587 [Actinostola sp. cb2023]